MRPKDEMLIDCAAIDQAYTYLTKPEHLASVRVAGDVVELLTALEASGTEIERLQTELDAKSDKRAAPKEHHQLRDVLRERDEVFARCEKAEKERDEAQCKAFEWRNERDEARADCDELELDLGISDARVKSIEYAKVTQQRDEAREWANRRHQVTQHWRTRYNEAIGENAKLRRNELDDERDIAVLWQSNGEADKEIGELKAKIIAQEQEALDAMHTLRDAGIASVASIADTALGIQRKINTAHQEEIDDLNRQLATASNDLRTQLTSALLEREQGLRPTFAGVRDAYDTTVDIAVRARAQRDGARNGALDEAAERAHKILYNTCTAFRFADRVAAEIRALKSE